MCNGITVLVWTENGKLKGLCTGETSHDTLCQENENLRFGKIEPYRFELLYPCNLVYDRGAETLPLKEGICGEQPPLKVWNAAWEHAKPYFMKHTPKQLQYATLTGADLTEADLTEADLKGANLKGANLKGANLTEADLKWANLKWANLKGANLTEADLKWANLKGANLPDDFVIPKGAIQ